MENASEELYKAKLKLNKQVEQQQVKLSE